MRIAFSVLLALFLSTSIFAQAEEIEPPHEEFALLEPETITDLAEGHTRITLRSNIRDAAVYLNGNFEGIVTLRLDDIMRGQYHLRMERNGYAARDFSIEVVAGCAQEYYIELSRIADGNAEGEIEPEPSVWVETE
jgi:hypothetical protein